MTLIPAAWWARSDSWENSPEHLGPEALYIGHGFLWTQLGVFVTFLTIVTKYLIIINLRNKEFLLVYSLRGMQVIVAGKG